MHANHYKFNPRLDRTKATKNVLGCLQCTKDFMLPVKKTCKLEIVNYSGFYFGSARIINYPHEGTYLRT